MKYEVTLSRKKTTNEAQNARKIREQVSALSEDDAKLIALNANRNYRYFIVDSVRRV